MKKNKVFILLTISIAAALLIPSLIQNGMFLDGVTYGSISRNLAQGIGEFWNLQYTKTCHTSFYDHPPLVFGIQSIFFYVLGDGIYTERLYIVFTILLTCLGIVLCWQLFCNKTEYASFSWLAVLLFICTPIVSWSYKSNLLENTMSIFTIFSVYFISKALLKEKILLLLPGSALIILAFLSKGFVGLFPLATAMFYGLTTKFSKKIVVYSALIFLMVFALFCSLFMLFPDAKESLSLYCNHQLIPALIGKRETTTNNHFFILFKLILELSFPALILLISIIITRKKNINIPKSLKSSSLFFILIGISASLPLIIPLKQRAFYLVPSIPFFVISISMLILPFFKNSIEAFSESALILIKRLSICIISATLIISLFKIGKYSCDEELIKDVYIMSEAIPKASIISTTQENFYDWKLVAYMNRISLFSLDCDNRREYFLIKKDEKLDSTLNAYYLRLNLDLKRYLIFKRKPASL
jgi:4-amino-4-deoxy-L-arabinose transferase-like glycosyltransferase